MRGDNMEEDTLNVPIEDAKNIMKNLVQRATDFEKRMAAIEIRSLERQKNFFEKRYESLFAFMNKRDSSLVGEWIAKVTAEEVEEE